MNLAEQMQAMMDELLAIKHLNKSIQFDVNNSISVDGAKKIATLMTMIDNLQVPHIVASFESVGPDDIMNDENRGMA